MSSRFSLGRGAKKFGDAGAGMETSLTP